MMLGQSVTAGKVLSVLAKGTRRFTTTGNLANVSYSSDLPERFYNEEQLQMQQSLKKIIDTEINPYCDEWEAQEQMPSHHVWKLLGNAGFLGVHKPEEYGGMGLSYKYHAAILEELGTIKAFGVSSSISVHTDVVVPPVAMYGSDRLKKEFLVPSITGEFVGCVGSSEPEAGSDVSYIKLVYSSLFEIIVDFTRDYDVIKQALTKIDHYDKTCIANMLKAVNGILLSNWGSQNFCQVLVFTDCGIGFGPSSLSSTIATIKMGKTKKETDQESILPFSYTCKLSFICLGSTEDSYFETAVKLYQELLDASGQKGYLFIPKRKSDIDFVKKDEKLANTGPLNTQSINDLITKMCETNYKQFEAVLKCGGYFKLESPINIWPRPLPYTNKETEVTSIISRKLEICGFLSLSEIGSPMSISRHLILPKIDRNDKKYGKSEAINEYEKLEAEIKLFYSKTDGGNSDDESSSNSTNESSKESVCVLLHGALKVENMAALILLNENWFGFIYSYADSKKKSNLMLTVLPPGHDVIPWLGDLRYVGNLEDTQQPDNAVFPVKPVEKRSYSQNCVVWIKQAGLQSDIQKVLRHAKKLPEKTQNFYKELNRIRRAALSLGFVELLDGLSTLFEREIALLPSNASPDCALQLKHTAVELRKVTNRDLKTMITALPSKYNQL